MPQTDPPVNSEPRLPTDAELHYKSLTGYFQQLVKYTLGSAAVLLLIVGAIGFNSFREAAEVAKITAQERAVAAAEARIDELLKENAADLIDARIDAVVMPVVDEKLDAAIEKRVAAAEETMVKISEVTDLAGSLRAGSRGALDRLLFLREESPSLRVRQLAAKYVTDAAWHFRYAYFEGNDTGHYLDFFRETYTSGYKLNTLADLVAELYQRQEPERLMLGFLAFNEVTGADVPVFDYPALRAYIAKMEVANGAFLETPLANKAVKTE